MIFLDFNLTNVIIRRIVYEKQNNRRAPDVLHSYFMRKFGGVRKLLVDDNVRGQKNEKAEFLPENV